MFDDLMELIAQYVDAKSKLDRPYGEDDCLVLWQLSEAIAATYESMHWAGDEKAESLASRWHGISKTHFDSSAMDKMDEENSRGNAVKLGIEAEDGERRSFYENRQIQERLRQIHQDRLNRRETNEGREL